MATRIAGYLGLAIAALLTPPLALSADDAGTPQIPRALKSTIEKSYPGTRMIERNDLDEECEKEKSGGKQPGLLVADFNGDQIPDYAVVLMYTKPRKHPEWGMIHDYRVVVFLGTSNQQFKPFKIWEYESTDKTLWFAMLYNQKMVHDLHTGEQIKLKNPAVRLVRCSGGFGIYYWQGNSFKVAGGT